MKNYRAVTLEKAIKSPNKRIKVAAFTFQTSDGYTILRDGDDLTISHVDGDLSTVVEMPWARVVHALPVLPAQKAAK